MHISTKLKGLARRSGGIVLLAVTKVFDGLRLRLEQARRAAGRGRRMQVVESLALGGRRQLLLVRCDEQEYLVGTGPDRVETIVLRQPEVGAAAGGARAAACGDASIKAVPQAASTEGAGRLRAGARLRERPAHGPWLVTAAHTTAAATGQVAKGTMAKNRIREAGKGQGLESWQ